MPWIDVAGTDVHYLDEGTGLPLVFLHGFTSCAQAWFQQLEHFGSRHRVIAYDSVNHGMSSSSPRDAEEPDRADELEAVLGALCIERPVLLGNSMGGNTVLRWAARHPERALALVPSGTGVGGDGQPRAALREPIDEQTLLLPIGDSLTEGFAKREPRLYQRYLRIRSTATSIENRRHPRRPSAASSAERSGLAERVSRIRVPLLAIVGSLDAARLRAEELHKRVPRSEYCVIEGAPHNVYYEAAAEYNRQVDAFLERALS
jgi:pimeloyl-ACP methyl ester carboxylesterase